MGFFKKIPAWIAMGAVMAYRGLISPLFPSCCRFVPTCSEYSLIAFKRFGFLKGCKLTVKRLARCHPGGPYGYDPVPTEADLENLRRG